MGSSLPHGPSADVVFELVGTRGTMTHALSARRRRGRLVFIGFSEIRPTRPRPPWLAAVAEAGARIEQLEYHTVSEEAKGVALYE